MGSWSLHSQHHALEMSSRSAGFSGFSSFKCPTRPQASELYARLLGGERSIDWSGARLAFASVPNPAGKGEAMHGLSVTFVPDDPEQVVA